MAKTYVQDIIEGDHVDGVFLVDSVHKRFTKAKKKYLKFVLVDKSGQIESVMWAETMEKNPDIDNLRGGDYADVSGLAGVNRYTNRVEVVLNQVRKVSPSDLDLSDFLPQTERDIPEMKQELAELIDQADDPNIKKLLKKVFDDPEVAAAFEIAPAAKNYHHAYLGGLLEHSVSVGQLALLISDHYGVIDKSLLLAGAILHDIGKIREFNYTTKIDYSTQGRLTGHVVLGESIVARIADGIPDFPEELRVQISHLILSHQGEPEYGAAVKPKTKEAVMLNIIDNIDAKLNGWMQIAKKYGDSAEWTDFQSMFGDFLYLGSASRDSTAEKSSRSKKKTDSDTETLF